MAPPPTARRVVVVAHPGVQSLDVTGPVEVFNTARAFGASPAYTTELVAPGAGPVTTSSGLRLLPEHALGDCRGPIDTLVVAGGPGTRAAQHDEALLAWLRDAAGRSRRVTAVCTGALLLAAAGLLDGRRATTHWSLCATLARRFPAIEVDADRIYVRDGRFWTSAGVTAGMDLALALVDDDHGSELTLAVARQLVLYTRRAGGQSQFSVQLVTARAQRDDIRAVLAHIADNLDGDLSVPTLARLAAMSPRTFARTFRAETGTTPAAYVQAARVDAARRLLEVTSLGTTEIARSCGFGTPETMHRAFRRTVHTTPGRYRRHFTVARQPLPA